MSTVVEAIGLSCCKNRAARPNSAVLTEHARIDGNVVGSSELTMKHIHSAAASATVFEHDASNRRSWLPDIELGDSSGSLPNDCCPDYPNHQYIGSMARLLIVGRVSSHCQYLQLYCTFRLIDLTTQANRDLRRRCSYALPKRWQLVSSCLSAARIR